MSEILENSLQIAKLLYQKGDFLEAHSAFVRLESEALSCQDLKRWLDSLRLQMQCLSELDQFEKAEPLRDKLVAFHNEDRELAYLARVHSLLGFYYIQKRDLKTAQSYLSRSIHEATLSQDFDSLPRSLMLEVYLNSVAGHENWEAALDSLEKVDLILNAAPAPDIEITCLLMRTHIATRQTHFEEACRYLWVAYEKAQTQGHHLMIPSLLFQLGRLHRDLGQKAQAQLFFDLSLRGLDPVKHPRQYRLIAQEAQTEGMAARAQFDFVVNPTTHSIREKHRGCVDFKNQHILFELALLFLKNPGRRYNKEGILELVWSQTYNPSHHDNLIYVSIKRLRSLIEPSAENPQYILRDRRGYYLNSSCSISFEAAQEDHP